MWAHPAQAPDRAIRSNSSVRLRRTCGISASIPCASLCDTVSRQEAVSSSTIPSTGGHAFSGYTSLTTVKLPASASTGSYAFSETGTAALAITLIFEDLVEGQNE
jgi:hypothetical protein